MGGANGANDLGSNNEPMAHGDAWSGLLDSKGRRSARGRGDEDEYCSSFVSGRT